MRRLKGIILLGLMLAALVFVIVGLVQGSWFFSAIGAALGIVTFCTIVFLANREQARNHPPRG